MHVYEIKPRKDALNFARITSLCRYNDFEMTQVEQFWRFLARRNRLWRVAAFLVALPSRRQKLDCKLQSNYS